MTPDDLRQWRRDHQMSQGKLALALGVDHMTVSRWERGIRGIPAYLDLALQALCSPSPALNAAQRAEGLDQR